jgi:hypothetical protein
VVPPPDLDRGRHSTTGTRLTDVRFDRTGCPKPRSMTSGWCSDGGRRRMPPYRAIEARGEGRMSTDDYTDSGSRSCAATLRLTIQGERGRLLARGWDHRPYRSNDDPSVGLFGFDLRLTVRLILTVSFRGRRRFASDGPPARHAHEWHDRSYRRDIIAQPRASRPRPSLGEVPCASTWS